MMSSAEKTLILVDNEKTKKTRFNFKKLTKLKKVISQLGIFIFFVFYTVAGAKIFQELEHPWEVKRQVESGLLIIEARKHLISELTNMDKSDWQGNFTSSISLKLKQYERKIEIARQDGVSILTPDARNYKWNFIHSVFFASTVITTIGYGNIAPMTFGGRLFCILYGFVGIPVTVTVIAELGNVFANGISRVYKKMHRKLQSTTPKDEHQLFGDKTIRGLMVLGAVLAWLIFLSFGATLFITWEDWTFFEAFYFCFITMTTIGLGDFVPEKKEFMLVCTIYILIGLALTSTIIELVRRQYAESWQQMKELSGRLGELSGPLAEQLKKFGHHDLSLDLNISSELKELRNAIHLYRLEALYKLDPKWKNDKALVEIIQSHLEASKEKEEEETTKLVTKKKVIQVIIYESSV